MRMQVMEYAGGGELFDLMQNTLRERDVRPLFRQLVHAVGYCHAKGYVHRCARAESLNIGVILAAAHLIYSPPHSLTRASPGSDLKPENLLLSAQRQLKVADFGFASEYQPGRALDMYCGSVPYSSPGTPWFPPPSCFIKSSFLTVPLINCTVSALPHFWCPQRCCWASRTTGPAWISGRWA